MNNQDLVQQLRYGDLIRSKNQTFQEFSDEILFGICPSYIPLTPGLCTRFNTLLTGLSEKVLELIAGKDFNHRSKSLQNFEILLNYYKIDLECQLFSLAVANKNPKCKEELKIIYYMIGLNNNTDLIKETIEVPVEIKKRLIDIIHKA